jgi:hypothetical protein
MPAWAATLLVVAGTAALTWAGLEKARDRAPLAATLAALGLPRRLATPGAIAVPAVELGTVLCVVLAAPVPIAAVLFAGLGIGFAAAGVRALTAKRVITCACFGSSERRLGWFQVVTLPLWLLTAWASAELPASMLQLRIATFASAMLLLAVVRAIPALRRGVAARADRRALAGT